MKYPFTGFFAAGLALAALTFAPGCTSVDQPSSSKPVSRSAAPDSGWANYPSIVAKIKAPQFPDRTFSILDYGAVAGGQKDCTDAIRQAIAACNEAGGGKVLVPAGVFLTGSIRLQSNVNLYVAEGATLQFSTDPKAYLPLVRSRWEGTECMNYSALIYAYDQENIAVTGAGTLDGGASDANWWAWAKKTSGRPARATADVKKLNDYGDSGTPVEQRIFGEGSFLRPNFFQPYRCRNVLIEGLTLHRSPMWEINPVLCDNVTVRGLKIESHGPNNDGCDPDSSRNVLIENCVFDTGDDCIAIKSGRNDDGRRVGQPSENIIVRNCTMKDGHGGVVIGSEISGGCRNVFVENCEMDSPNLERALRFKSNARRGGVVENVFMRNVRIGRVAEAILTVDFLYEEGAKGTHMPTVRNVSIENVTSQSSPRVFFVTGFPGAVIDDIRLSHCSFNGVEASEVVQFATNISMNDVSIMPAKKPKSLNSRPAVTEATAP